MPETDIGSAVASDLANATTDYSIDEISLDSPSPTGKTRYDNTNRRKWLGYYKKTPELKKAINTKASWTMGKGFNADDETTLLLDTIRGWGKDTFNTILEACIRDYHISGDSFCEIIRDKQGNLVNLKILNPEFITIISNNKGRILGYEQNANVKGATNTYTPDKIFHLAKDRISDEIHGDGIVEVLEPIILARNEDKIKQKELEKACMFLKVLLFQN